MLLPPSPKVQDQEVGVLVDWSVKFTVSGTGPPVGGAAVKAATGGPAVTVM